MRVWNLRVGIAAAILAGLLSPLRASADTFFQQTNLVSDIPGLAANTDARLVNPWGISEGPATPFWVSDQVTGLATLYNSAGTPQGLVVTIPPVGANPVGHPTGQVFNGTTGFLTNPGVSTSQAHFIFAGTDGSISGWNAGTSAVQEVVTPGAAYTGLAEAVVGGNPVLYAANARAAAGTSGIDIFNSTWGATTLSGTFLDPNLPAGLTPYDVQNINGTLFVTYSHRGQVGGVVDAFDLNGNLLRRVATGGPLDQPWGLAIAPSSFGEFAGKLLVGNFGDGRITVYDPNAVDGAAIAQLRDPSGAFISNPGLWGLIVGNGGAGGRSDTLYFSAGIQNETHGLFGSLTAVPEPTTMTLFAIGGAAVWVRKRRRAQS